MSRIVWDGFDSYSSLTDPSQIKRWTGVNMDPGLNSGGNTRFGVGLCMQGHGSGRYLYKTLSGNHYFLGFAIRSTGVAPGSTLPMFSFLDGVTYQATATYSADKSFAIRLGDYAAAALDSQVLWTGSAAAYIWLELEFLFDTSAGIARAWREGVLVMDHSGINTAQSGAGQATQFRLGQSGNSGGEEFYLDDFYLNDSAGGAPFNGRMGDSRVYLLTPNAAGDLTQMTPDSGSNYQRVQSVDDDSSYVSTGTVGNADLYNQSDLPAGFVGSIWSVAHTTRWRKDDAGARSAAQLLKSGTTTVQGSDVALLTSYDDEVAFHDTDPDTAAAWDAAGVNALQTGAKLTV